MKLVNRRTFLTTSALGTLGLAFGNSEAKPVINSTNAVTYRVTYPIGSSTAEVKSAGIKMISIEGGKYRVWTKRVGMGKIKVLTLHGGPGITHEYFECFEDFLPQEGIEFYYYDQLGSHYSDQPTDASLWTLPRFVEEVEQVRNALGLEKFYLYGQSWGGLLGIDYSLKYGQHLKGFILSNMTASSKAYEKHVADLRRALPENVIAVLDKYEAKKDYENPEYQETMLNNIYTQYLCRLNPFPEPIERALRHINPQVYNVMQGPNEFVITGNLKTWDRWQDLSKIACPTLVIGAKYDTMNLEDLKKESEIIPQARFALCENGSHFCLYDDQESYFRHFLKFIKDNESGIKMK